MRANDLTDVVVGDPLLTRVDRWGKDTVTVIVTKTTATVVHTDDGRKWRRKDGDLSPKSKEYRRQPFAERTGPKWDAIVEAERIRTADVVTIEKKVRHFYSWSQGLTNDQIHRIAEILREIP